MILRFEWMDVQRVVYLNQREHPKNGPRTSLGHSIGRFEGDTLVIETANYSAGVLNQYVEQAGQPTRGLLHSAALTSVERVRLDAETPAAGGRDHVEGSGVLHARFRSLAHGVPAFGPEAGAIQLLARRRGWNAEEVAGHSLRANRGLHFFCTIIR